MGKTDKRRGTRRRPPAGGGPLRPEVAEFMRVRESLRDPEVYRNPERFEEVKKRVWELQRKATQVSPQLRARIHATQEEQKMRFNYSVPQAVETSPTPLFPMMSPMGMAPPAQDHLVWVCPRCGNDKVNFKVLNRKRRRQIRKQHPWLTKGDVRKGLRYCFKCTQSLGYDVPMRKMPYSEILKLKEAAYEASIRKR